MVKKFEVFLRNMKPKWRGCKDEEKTKTRHLHLNLSSWHGVMSHCIMFFGHLKWKYNILYCITTSNKQCNAGIFLLSFFDNIHACILAWCLHVSYIIFIILIVSYHIVDGGAGAYRWANIHTREKRAYTHSNTQNRIRVVHIYTLNRSNKFELAIVLLCVRGILIWTWEMRLAIISWRQVLPSLAIPACVENFH